MALEWLNQVGGMLQQYAGASAQQPPTSTEQDFQNVAPHAPKEHMAEGLAEAFRSNQTPPFEHMLGSLFGQSAPNQKADVLRALMGVLGPGTLSQILARQGAS